MASDLAASDELLRRAASAFQAGRMVEARDHAERALQLTPQNVDALNIQSLALHALGQHREAAAAFTLLTRWQPAVAGHWVNLGTACRAAKQLDKALEAYKRAAELGEDSANLYYSVGLLQLDRHHPIAAEAALSRARELAPGDAEIAYYYAECCYTRLENDQALQAIENWRQLQGLSDAVLAKIALLLTKLGEPARAHAAIATLSTRGQLDPATTLTLLQVYERINRLPEADALLQALRNNPDATTSLASDLTAAEGLLAQRAGDHARASSLLTAAAQQCAEPHQRHHPLFRLAKSLDALGEYDAALRTLEEAHQSQAAALQFTAPQAIARLSMRLAEFGCDADDVARWDEQDAPSAAASPIFIVGFPRSGTTLLEQALDAHPALQSMDEQPFLQKILDQVTASGIDYARGLSRMRPEQLSAARKHYWQLVERKVTLRDGQRLVDKNPLNMMGLPLIRRLFPNAHILLAVRHPCDVVLSCFMQHFGAPEFALLCGDLTRLATGYSNAFNFWYEEAALLRPAVREVRYESFVADFSTEIRMVTEFLELPWNAAVLQPGEHARAKGFISTPSYAQVVQPINASSIGRWQNYRAHFSDALPLLEPWLRRWGYGTGGLTASPPV